MIDSAIFPQLRDEMQRLQWQRDCEKLWPRFQSAISSLKVKLFPYQKEGVRRALQAGRFIIADEMGLGKTIQGIAWAEALLRSDTVKRVLVICPNALKFQWQRGWFKSSGREICIVVHQNVMTEFQNEVTNMDADDSEEDDGDSTSEIQDNVQGHDSDELVAVPVSESTPAPVETAPVAIFKKT